MRYGLQKPAQVSFTTCLLILTCLMLTSCASRISRTTLVFDYADFGPQAMAYRLIGAKNYQWDPHAPIPFGNEGVRVVVYRNISLEEVERHFPVSPESLRDYRYVAYAEAMDYLDARIRQNLLRRITERLEQTRDQLRAHLE